MAGRPSDFTQEIAKAICDRLSVGESLRSICEDEAMPDKSTVMRWIGNPEHGTFRDHYACAREAQADFWAEEILDISDDSVGDVSIDDNGNIRPNSEFIARSRLRVDTRKWLMGRMAPKKYGDRVTQEVVGPGGGPVQTEDLTDMTPTQRARRIAFALAQGSREQAKTK